MNRIYKTFLVCVTDKKIIAYRLNRTVPIRKSAYLLGITSYNNTDVMKITQDGGTLLMKGKRLFFAYHKERAAKYKRR